MINLIPPEAKKIVQREFRIRFIAVCAVLFSSAGLLVAIMFIPVYVFITIQISNLTGLVQDADLAVQTNAVTAPLQAANQQATLLISTTTPYKISNVMIALPELVGEGVSITSVRLQQTLVPTVQISGQATSRSALVSFRDALEKKLLPTKLDLPIGNLLKETDLEFSLTMTLSTSTITI